MSIFRAVENREWVQKQKLRKRPRWSKTRNPKRLEALSKRFGSAISADLVTGINTFRRKIPNPETIYQAWLDGNYEGISRVIPWDELHKSLQPARNRLFEGLEVFGNLGLEVIKEPERPKLRYDYKNPHIQRVFDKRAGEWIVKISGDTRDSIKEVVHRQMTQGVSPRQMSEEIRNMVGLYPRLANAHANYVNQLEKKGLHPERVKVLGDRYYQELLTYRAKTIARTETQFMLNRGQLEVWKEGARQGFIPKTAKKVWITDGDPCDEICDPMDGEMVGLYDSWSLPNGDEVDIPTESHPNCQCIMTIEFDEEDDDDQEEIEKAEDDDDGQWITVNGVHIHLDGNGNQDKGPKIEKPKGEVKEPSKGSRMIRTNAEPEDLVKEKSPDTPEEEAAMMDYKGVPDVNNSLRSGKLNAEEQKQVEQMDKVFGKSELKSDCELYRLVQSSNYTDNPESFVGKVVEDKGFMSTTTKQSYVHETVEELNAGGVMLRIIAPKGTKAVNMEKYNKGFARQQNQHEVLLHRGTKLKFISVKDSSIPGIKEIHAEVVE